VTRLYHLFRGDFAIDLHRVGAGLGSLLWRHDECQWVVLSRESGERSGSFNVVVVLMTLSRSAFG
jgi:hypothetical protein